MGFIPEDAISQVLDRCHIVEVVSSYVPLKQAGRNFKACCPFHQEKTPSFVVNPDKQIFHCFGCGVGGNVISFVMQQERLEFPAAVRLLANKAGVVIPDQDGPRDRTLQLRQRILGVNDLAANFYHKILLSDKTEVAQQAREYLKGRGISLDIVKRFQVGLATDQWDRLMGFLKTQNVDLALMEKAGLIIPQNKGKGFYDRFRKRIIFPISDSQGRPVAFGARALELDNPAKYINSPETSVYTKGRHLYGFPWAKEAIGRADCAVVVEGYLDFIVPFQAGFENIIASLGTALTVEQIRLLRRYTHHVTMLFDADQAGEAAMIRSLDLLVEEGMTVKVASLSPGEDPDSFVRSHGVKLFRERVESAESLFDFKFRKLSTAFGASTVEARARVASEMLHTIGRFANAIIKSEYVKKLAQRLSLDPEALLTELKRSGSQDRAMRPVTSTARSVGSSVLRPAERDILGLMLEDRQFVALTKAELALDDFQEGLPRQLVEKIFEIDGQVVNDVCQGVMSAFQDQESLRVISGLVSNAQCLSGDRKRIHRDCVARIKQEGLRGRRKRILLDMQAAKATGDSKHLEDLTREFNQLIKIKG